MKRGAHYFQLRAAIVLGLVIGGTVDAGAQSIPPPMTSNRPGLAESEALMAPRAVQVEGGFTVAAFSSDAARHRLWDLPEATIRVGLTPRVELFAVAAGLWVDRVREAGTTTSTVGGSDVQLNAKLGVLEEGRDPFTLSVAAGLSLPTGAEEFSSGGYNPSLRLLWARSLPQQWTVGGNVALSGSSADGERIAVAATGLGAGRPLTQSSSWFVEVFGTMPRGGVSEWRFDSGVAFMTSTNIQLDVSAGRTLARGPAAWFISAGVSARRLF